MGVSLTNPTASTTMSATATQTELTKGLVYLNGGVVAGDLDSVNMPVRTVHMPRMETFESPLHHSVGQMQTFHGYSTCQDTLRHEQRNEGRHDLYPQMLDVDGYWTVPTLVGRARTKDATGLIIIRVNFGAYVVDDLSTAATYMGLFRLCYRNPTTGSIAIPTAASFRRLYARPAGNGGPNINFNMTAHITGITGLHDIFVRYERDGSAFSNGFSAAPTRYQQIMIGYTSLSVQVRHNA